MVVHFFDKQDVLNPLNGAVIHCEQSLSDLFEPLRRREPSFCELVGNNGFKLLVGVGHDIGCIQYSPTDGDTPYLMAVASDAANSDGYTEFLMADTPTPIPLRYCLPLQVVRRIITEFVQSGERSRSIEWEEI